MPVIAGREISGLAFYARSGVQRAFLTRTDATGSLGIWDNDLAGTEVRLTTLGPPNGGNVIAPSPTPDGEHLWFRQDTFAVGTYYGSRADGWQKQQSTLGFVDVLVGRPSPVGFYDGTARMLVQIQDTSRNAFVEISSPGRDDLDRARHVQARAPRLADSAQCVPQPGRLRRRGECLGGRLLQALHRRTRRDGLVLGSADGDRRDRTWMLPFATRDDDGSRQPVVHRDEQPARAAASLAR